MKLDELTKKQEGKMVEIKEKWIALCDHSPTIQQEKIIPLIHWVYSLAKLSSPLVLVVDSPLAAKYAVKTMEQVRERVGDQVVDQVRAQVREQVMAQVMGQVDDQVGVQARDQARDRALVQARLQALQRAHLPLALAGRLV